MSMQDDFLTDNLTQSESQWANDAQNTGCTRVNSENHHKRHSHNCIPSRQKNARDFLAGNTPGVMAFYAPEEQCRATQHPNPQPANIIANTRPDNATVEDAETVQRLVEWREEASY